MQTPAAPAHSTSNGIPMQRAVLGISKAMSFQMSPRETMVGRSSVSRPPHDVDLGSALTLFAFSPPTTRQAALERLRGSGLQIATRTFVANVRDLIAAGFLVDVAERSGNEPGLATGVFANVINHHRMLQDTTRVLAYRAAIGRQCRGARVVEIGCGSGVLSLFAADAGAEAVVAIEESAIASLAAEMFELNDSLGIIELIRGNSRDVVLAEKADVIIHELFGVEPLGENVLEFIRDAKTRLLRPGGKLLPYRIEILCVGVEANGWVGLEKKTLVDEARELGLLYGLNVAPIAKRMATLGRRQLLPAYLPMFGQKFEPRVLTAPCRLLDIDLEAEEWDIPPFRKLDMRIERPGRLNGVVVYFRAHLDRDSVVSNAPHAPPTHWGWRVRCVSEELVVTAGMNVPIDVRIRTRGQHTIDVDWHKVEPESSV